jgi:phospholipase/lecithinase/hemolysin
LASSVAQPASAHTRHTPAPKTDVNFAFGGATTGAANATAAFAPELDAAVRAAGLELVGLETTLELALQTLDGVDGARDVFWVWAGLNNYLIGGLDPTVAPGQLVAAMESLYAELGARLFVVPNLFRGGMLPLAAALPPGAADGLSALTAAHNAVLASALAGFAATHPDATVVPVDVAAIFASFAANPTFTNLTESCVDVALPQGLGCEGWLFFDTVHPTSAAMAYVAQAAADATVAARHGAPVRRVVTIGDKQSDTGMFYDTALRSVGQGFPPSPPFYAGRFADGPNALDQYEALIAPAYPTTFFAQPKRATLVAEDLGHGLLARGSLALQGEVYVRRSLDAGGAAFARLRLGRERCYYTEVAAGQPLELWFCSGGLGRGDRVATDEVELMAWGVADAPIAVDLFYRES